MMTTDTSLPLDPADIPYGGLPSADTRILIGAPIETAIAEVRFSTPTAAVTPRHATALRAALEAATGAEFTIVEAATEGTTQIELGPDGPSVSHQQIVAGWRIATADRQLTAALFPHTAIWQVNIYERWSESMAPALAAMVNLLEDALKPDLVHRVGLRYVNRLSGAPGQGATDWAGRIDSSLIGAVANRAFGPLLVAAQQQVELVLDGSHGALFRHGTIPNPTGTALDYLLDLDVFAHATDSFDSSSIIQTAQRLNRTSLSLFQASLDEAHLAALPRREE